MRAVNRLSSAVFLFQRHTPIAAVVRRADLTQAVANQLEILGRQQLAMMEHLGVSNGGAHVVGHEAVVERVIFARRVLEHTLIERLALVPQARQVSGPRSAVPRRSAH
jgi:hypothetical protein